jgi:polysaccharide export outer membrane protein
MRYALLLAVALTTLAPLTPPAVLAQVLPDSDPGRSVRTRADLERLLAEYDAALASPAYSESVKRAVRADAQRVRTRLRDGDFRVGDRIALYVQGESNLPPDVPVESGPAISLPLFGEISLHGVLRSEISDHLTKELGRFIKDPVVRADGLMRLSIQGEVGSPGFYVVPAEMLVGEALMVAGGPGSQADLDALRIERGSDRLMEGEELQEAMRDGRTLDQLNLQAGDQIVLPQARTGAGIWGAVLRYGLIIGSTVLLGVRIAG